MNLKTLAAASVLAGAVLAPSAGAQQTILSNLPGVGSGTGTNLGLGNDAADRTKGVGLTMGSQSLDFYCMTALISNTTPDTMLSGGIYSDLSGNPGSLLAAFTPVAVGANAAAAEVDIFTASTFTLQANTSYWFLLDGPTTTNSLLWETLNPNAAPVGAVGITFDGYRFSSNGGSTWSSSSLFNGVSIKVVPTPASAALLGLGGLVAVRRRR